MNDPLTLKLVADTYKGKPVPKVINPDEINQKYFDQLIAEKRLADEDVAFLEAYLMPLMLAPDHYSNEITSTQLYDSTVPGSNGKPLFEAILLDEQNIEWAMAQAILSKFEGRRNPDQRWPATDYQIRFKYERFYDYFGGRRLYQMALKVDKLTFYQEMIEKTLNTPFLWGPVQSALVLHTRKQGTEMLQQLCFTRQQRVKEMLVKVLCELGNSPNYRGLVETFLEDLIPAAPNLTQIQRARQLLPGKAKTKATIEIETRNAWKIGIEVASTLGIVSILKTAALQNDITLRTTAIRYTYHLWQRDPDAGFEVVRYLSKNLSHGPLPDPPACETFISLSLIILCEGAANASTMATLRQIWQAIIKQLFVPKDRANIVERKAKELFREKFFSVAINLMLRLVKEMFGGKNLTNFPDLELFFNRTNEEKAFYLRLVSYINKKPTEYMLTELEEDLTRAITMSDLMVNLVVTMVLTTRLAPDPLTALPLLQNFFEKARVSEVPNIYIYTVPTVIATILDHNPKSTAYFKYLVYTLDVYRSYYRQYPGIAPLNFTPAPDTSYLATYIFHQYQRSGNANTKWLADRVSSALSSQDIYFFEGLLKSELPMVAFDLNKPQAALDTLSLFFPLLTGESAITQLTCTFLARLHLYYPDEVKIFWTNIKQPKPSDYTCA